MVLSSWLRVSARSAANVAITVSTTATTISTERPSTLPSCDRCVSLWLAVSFSSADGSRDPPELGSVSASASALVSAVRLALAGVRSVPVISPRLGVRRVVGLVSARYRLSDKHARGDNRNAGEGEHGKQKYGLD